MALMRSFRLTGPRMTGSSATADEDKVSRHRYERERLARQQAEHLLEVKSRELFEANQALVKHLQDLEEQIKARTRELESAKVLAEAANRAKSGFLANMSHELRTPLNGIIGIADALTADLVEPKLRRMATLIAGSGESLMDLLNDILDLSKVEAGHMELVLAPFSLRITLDKVSALHVIRASEKSVDLIVDIAPDLPKAVLGDCHRVSQILHNLLSNAVKFTPKGQIRLAARRDFSGALVLSVADTGIGMTPDQARRLFNRFEQAETTTARHYGGTGLGMAIVKELVDLMKGAVKVQTAPGAGTMISVTLPLPAAKLVQHDRAAVLANMPDLSAVHCLAADDNAINRETLEALLAPTGLNLTLAEDGQQAIELFAASPERFDLLLLDISMPRVGGVEALLDIRRLAAQAKAPLVPAIALTANAMEEDRRAFLEAGFSDVLIKPFRRKELAELILQTITPQADQA